MPRRGENIKRRKDGRWEVRYKKGVSGSGCTVLYMENGIFCICIFRFFTGKLLLDSTERLLQGHDDGQEKRPEDCQVYRRWDTNRQMLQWKLSGTVFRNICPYIERNLLQNASLQQVPFYLIKIF